MVPRSFGEPRLRRLFRPRGTRRQSVYYGLLTQDNVKVDNFGRAGFSGIERVICLDEATGKELWKHEYDCPYSISYPGGPRCTPVVENGLVYSLGAEGNLICLKADSGEVVWQKALKQEYKTKSALWGYSAHPLIDGDNLNHFGRW